jgi:hypothetical protein
MNVSDIRRALPSFIAMSLSASVNQKVYLAQFHEPTRNVEMKSKRYDFLRYESGSARRSHGHRPTFGGDQFAALLYRAYPKEIGPLGESEIEVHEQLDTAKCPASDHKS